MNTQDASKILHPPPSRAGIDTPSNLSASTAAFPETDTGTPPTVMPSVIPLGRETRDPKGAERVAAQQAADHERQLADSAAPRPGQVLTGAVVTPQELGLSFLPNATPMPESGMRTTEPGYGRTVSTQLRSSMNLEDGLGYYRHELSQRWPQSRVEETRTGPGFAVLTSSDPRGPSRVSVVLDATAGPLLVTLSRWQADTQAPDVAVDGAGR